MNLITDSHWPFCGGVELRHIPLSRCDNHFAIHGIAANSSVGFLFHHFPQYNDEPIDPIPNFPNKNQEFYYIVHVGMTNTVYIYISLSLDIYIYVYIKDDRFVCLAPCFAWCFPTPQGAWKDGPAARFVVDGYPRSEEQLRPNTEPIRAFFFFERFGVGSFRQSKFHGD